MKNGKTKEKKKPSVIGIFTVLAVIISCLLIIFRSEQGPIFGLLIIAACFVFPVMGLVIIELIWLIIKKRLSKMHNRVKMGKMRRYRRKYVAGFLLDVPGFGSHLFERDSKTGKVRTLFFSDFDTPHDWESTDIKIDADEALLDKALDALGYISDNRDLLIGRVGSALADFFGKPTDGDVLEDDVTKPFEIPFIYVYSENGELLADFEGTYFGSQSYPFLSRLDVATNELTLED